MKRLIEQEPGDLTAPDVVEIHCELCGEFESECICADVASEGHVSADLDSWLTRSPAHPTDGNDF